MISSLTKLSHEMKLVRRNIQEKTGEGEVTLRAEDAEDMWHLYNLLHRGDCLTTSTVRKVTKEGMTGSTSSAKVRLNLTIDIEEIDFDSSVCLLRVSGRTKNPNPHVRLGAYHTFDVDVQQNITLAKPEWSSVSLEQLELATNIAKQADVGAIVMQLGLAHLCLLKGTNREYLVE